jgi:two-component sensor histidine kinase
MKRNSKKIEIDIIPQKLRNIISKLVHENCFSKLKEDEQEIIQADAITFVKNKIENYENKISIKEIRKIIKETIFRIKNHIEVLSSIDNETMQYV